MKDPVRTLRIDGIKTTITPKPDDAELAAQALLESMAAPEVRSQSSDIRPQTSAYYKDLSEKIKAAHEHDKRAAMRYVAYCEAQITSADSHQPSDLAEMERGLCKHQDAIEREGGELKKRWQHCLAEVTVRLMDNPNLNLNDNLNFSHTDITDNTE